ncbi:MAG: hypothetical protein WC449_03695 [Candidatus Paceibacterota bacterium]
MSDKGQEAVKLLESLENDLESRKEKSFLAIFEDQRFKEARKICQQEKEGVYREIFRHLEDRKQFATALLLDLAIGVEEVEEAVKGAIITKDSQVRYDTRKYVAAIINYGYKKGFLVLENPQEKTLKIIELIEADRHCRYSSNIQTYLENPIVIKLIDECAGTDKHAIMEGLMLHIKNKLSWVPLVIINEIASKYFELELPKIPENWQGRLSKINNKYLVWGLGNGLYPIATEKERFDKEMLDLESAFLHVSGKKFSQLIGAMRTHFKKPILVWLCLNYLDNNHCGELAIKVLEYCVESPPCEDSGKTEAEINYAKDSWLRWGFEEGYILHNSWPQK